MTFAHHSPILTTAIAILREGKTLDPADVKHASLRLHARLAGLGLSEADAVAADVRRVLWVKAFTGAPLAHVVEQHAHSSLAAEIAAELSDLSVVAVDVILDDLRFGLYVNAFGTEPSSRFGTLLAEAVDQAEAPQAADRATRH